MNNIKFKLETSELVRKARRTFDSTKTLSYRKIFLILFFLAVIILYLGPSLFRWLFAAPSSAVKGNINASTHIIYILLT